MVGDGIHGVHITVMAIIISRFITEPAVMHIVTTLRTTTATTALEAIITFQTTAVPEQQTVALEHNKDIHREIFAKTPIKHHVFTTSELLILRTINQIIHDLTMVQPVLHHQIARDIMLHDTTTIHQPEATLDILVEATAEETTAEEATAVVVVQAEEEDKYKIRHEFRV